MSEKIDLGDPATYRDLAKPIGALNEDRLERFQERYRSLQGDESVAPFFYGTHYSSAGIVLWYLLRMAPYTALSHSLQVRPLPHNSRSAELEPSPGNVSAKHLLNLNLNFYISDLNFCLSFGQPALMQK